MDKVLIIDDSPIFRRIYKNLLEGKEIICEEASNGQEAIEILEKSDNQFYALLVDQEMPTMDGLSFLEYVKSQKNFNEIPVIFVSSIDDSFFIKKVLGLGVYDFLIKPVDKDIFYLKIRNALEFYHRELYLKKLNKFIGDKNQEFAKTQKETTKTTRDVLLVLLDALECQNKNERNHPHRLTLYAELIATKMHFSIEFINELKLYGIYHDIGKLLIDSNILKKPEKLTVEEYEIVKTHSELGYQMIKNINIPDLGKNIIRYHHEKWNGLGYPFGLSGENIPIEARIFAICDVFDALINEKTYKPAFSVEEVIEILESEINESFQKEIVEIVLENIEKMLIINNNN